MQAGGESLCPSALSRLHLYAPAVHVPFTVARRAWRPLIKEPFVKRLSARTVLFTLASLGVGMFGMASAAQARSDVYFSIGVPGAPAPYVAPAPVYAEPTPAYVQPAPTYGYAQPVYTEPPVYVQSAPVYVQPGYAVEQERDWRREAWHREEWRREEWRRREWERRHWQHHHRWDE